MNRPWFARLEPTTARVIPRDSVIPDRAQALVELLGPGPVGWAIELGALMATNITVAIPELAVDAVAAEVAKGCEAVALGALSALAIDDQVSIAAMPEVLAGPMEVVARGIGIEHMLRSIQLAHSTAAAVLLDAAERVVPEVNRFAEMRRIHQAMFGIVDVITKRMADEYARAHDAWLSSSVALRAEIVEELLNGTVVPLDRATRTLGYDLSRWHLAVIVWTDATAPVESVQLRTAATEMLAAAGCTATLVLPVGAQRVWAWGSRISQPPQVLVTYTPPSPGIHLAVGTPHRSVEGFRTSHQQAAAAARVGAMSTREISVFCYQELDIVAMLSTELSAAREFVCRELGGLVDTSAATTVVRHTLKRYLDFDRSLARAAADLHIARNTVAYRVQRAEELRGQPATVRRLQLHAALTVADELGANVLRPTASDLD